MHYDLDGKSVFITGGASGLGRETALLAIRNGARVALFDRDADMLAQTTDEIRQEGGQAIGCLGDVTDAVSLASAVADAGAAFGPIHHAFNSAGIGGGMGMPTAVMDHDVWHQVIGVNLTGIFLSMQAQIAAMLAAGQGGSIVNAASVAGLVGGHVNVAYHASKHGVVGATRSAALEYARAGIRVNCVCPGWIETPLTAPLADDPAHEQMAQAHPIGRTGEPAEVAHLVAWLWSDAASFMVGAAVPVDGGFTAR